MHTSFIKKYFFPACLLITAINSSYAFKTGTNNAFVIRYVKDTIVRKDSVVKPPPPKKSFIDEKVTYSADDSMIIDKESKKAYLYNHAVVVYGDMKLTAGYIEIDFGKNMIYSKGIKDSLGKIVQRPVSEQAGEKFTAGEITYNFKTKKGKIKDVVTQQGEGYIHGGGIKKDSTNMFNVAHGKYTTCNLDHPHFYIGAKKIKVIPEDKIITGPAQLVIMDVPTPLAIPFGFFPNKKGRASGIIIPTYGNSTTMGYNLQNGGYYFGNNEHVDLALTGNGYTNGSYGLMALSNYKLRYQYNGVVNLKYYYNINGNPLFSTTTRGSNYSIVWRHTQDTKSHPGSSFSANVNMASALNNKYNGDVASGQYNTNTLQSNVSYSKRLGSNFNFSANVMQSQNNIIQQTNYDLPNLALTMNRIYPFKNDKRLGAHWYDKIGISATANAKNTLTRKDTTFSYKVKVPSTSETVNDSITKTKDSLMSKFKNGVQLNIPISTSLNLFKYVIVNPAINTSTFLYPTTTQESYNAAKKVIQTEIVNKPGIAAQYSFSTGFKTLLYGNYLFRSRRLKQIRHVITPAINLSYTPDFSESQYGYYKKVQDSMGIPHQYSMFQNGIFGGPSNGEQSLIGYSLNNTLEAKVKKQSDTGSVTKKVVLIQALTISGNYNAAAKLNKWSPISIAGRTQLFKLLNVNGSATLNPYQINGEGQQIQKFEWANNKIGRLTAANLALSASFRSKKKTKPKTTNSLAQSDELDYIRTHPNAYVDFNIPWILNVSYNFSYSNPGSLAQKNLTQAISFNGSLTVTKKWNISMTSGIDLKTNKPSTTSMSISRDLHCWQMLFTWVPFGLRQSYMLTLNVKSSLLQDLRIQRKGNWQDYQH